MKVLKFGAIWCPGCLVMKPRWEEIEKELTDLKTEYYDYDEELEMVNKWNIGDLLPVFIFVDKEGNELERIKGETRKETLIEIINKHKHK
jgi:thiol-disulfide isomerase/thioredoxin